MDQQPEARSEQKMVDESLTQRARSAAVGAEIGVALAASGPLHAIMQQCAEAVQRYVGGTAWVRLWTLDAAAYQLDLQASAGVAMEGAPQDRRVNVGQFSAGMVAQMRMPSVVDSAHPDGQREDLLWAWRAGKRVWAGFPLMVEDRLVGVMAIYATHPLAPVVLEVLPIISRAIALGVERRHAEERLRRAELTFRSFFLGSLDAMVVARRGVLVAANNAAARLHGFDRPDDLVGMGVTSLLAMEARDDAAGRMQRQAVGLTAPHAFDSSGMRKDGTTFDLDIHLSAYQVGGETYSLAVLRDITEQKRAAKELERSLSMLKATVDSTADGILVVDGNGRILIYNQKFAQMWRVPKPVLEGRDDNAVTQIALSQLTDPETYLARVRELTAMPDAESYDILHFKDGRVFERYSLPQKIGGKSVGRVWSFRDITEAKKAETALQESEARYKRLYNHTPVMLHSVDERGRLVSVSDYWLQSLEYTRKDVLGLPFYDFLTENSRHGAMERLTQLCRATCREVPLQFAKKGGGKVDVLLSSIAEHDAAGNPIGSLAVLIDVTEHHRLEEQLREVQKMEAVGRLAGGISHDFNNLLTSISGFAALLHEELGARHPLTGHVDQIARSADRATALTNQLLAFSRRQVMQPRVLDINRVIEDLEKLVRASVGEDIELVLKLGKKPGAVRADAAQVEQVIMNLAVNARDAMLTGGVLTMETGSVQLDASAARDVGLSGPGEYVKISVSDTGCGMDEETRAHIFEPFFSTKPRNKSAGLGLSTVYGIIQQSGGGIQVHSAVGEGATFCVYLPRVMEAAENIAVPAKSVAAVPGGSECVLVVEDEEDVRALVKAALQSKGYKVLEARNGAEALELCQRRRDRIDLMITDLIMPSMGGRELKERVAKLRPRMKVLFISGYSDGGPSGRKPQDDGAAFLPKPFKPAELARKVRQVLDEKRKG